MKIAIVVTKKGRICPDYGFWPDPEEAFRSLVEMSENGNKALEKHNVIVYDLKKLVSYIAPDKTIPGVDSDYYEVEEEE